MWEVMSSTSHISWLVAVVVLLCAGAAFSESELNEDVVESEMMKVRPVRSAVGETGPEVFHNRAVGDEYIIALMQNEGSTLKSIEKELSNEIFVTSASNQSLVVDLISPGLDLYNTYNVPGTQVVRINVTHIAHMVGSSRSMKGILVRSSHHASVVVVNKDSFSCDGFLALPTDVLGKGYYAICYGLPSIATEIGMAGVYNDTQLYIHFIGGSEDSEISVTFENITYKRNDFLNTSIDRFESIQLQCDNLCDLTGTYISSTKPLAVFSGNVRAGISGHSRDHLVEQLIPAESWGMDFPIMASSCYVSDVVVALAQEYTAVQLYTHTDDVISEYIERGGSIRWSIPACQLSYILSTKPIFVAQFLRSQHDPLNPADPSMVTVPAVSQHSNNYRFSTTDENGSDYSHHLLLTIRRADSSGIQIDGISIQSVVQWKSLGYVTDYVGAILHISSGTHTVTHINLLCNFGLILCSTADRKSVCFPLGLKLPILTECEETIMVVEDDGIDNDCDRYTDEEICNGFDDDGDGRIDEDCKSTPDTTTTTLSYTSTTTETLTTVAPSAPEPEIYDLFHCGREILDLACPGPSEWIQIVQAHYGRISYPGEMTCNVHNYQTYWENQYVDQVCGYVDHFSSVSALCDRRNDCPLDTTSFRAVANPCPANGLYLHLTYRCIGAFYYSRNELTFGAKHASSEKDVRPDAVIGCSLTSVHSTTGCDAACFSPLLMNSLSCNRGNCKAEESRYAADNVKSWCPDDVEVFCAYVDTFLGDTHMVEGVIIQGGRRKFGWVNKFSLFYSMDGKTWHLAPTEHVISHGNTDSVNSTLIKLSYPVAARWMRVKVVDFELFPYVHIAYIHHHAVEVCPKVTIRNSNIRRVDGLYNEQKRVICNRPYVISNLSSEYTITCNSEMQWDPIEHCDTLSCGLLPQWVETITVAENTIAVARLSSNYMCRPGDVNLGYELLACEKRTWTWQWEGQCCDSCLPSRSRCYAFPITINAGIANGQVSLAAGTVLQFECAEGYEPVSGSLESRCVLQGDVYVWDNEVIECSGGITQLHRYDPALPALGEFLSEAITTGNGSMAQYTIGHTTFSTVEATVACRQVLNNSQATGLAMNMELADIDTPHPIRYTDLQCDGSESDIWKCSYKWTIAATASAIASVVCYLPDFCVNGQVRLLPIAGSTEHGLVQVCYLNTWGTYAGIQHGWSESKATVACRQMHYTAALSIMPPGNFNGTATLDQLGPIWTYYGNCMGSEPTLMDCTQPSTSTLFWTGPAIRDRGHMTQFDQELAFAQCA